MAVFSSRSKQNLQGIHPDLVAVMELAIKTTPIDFTITDGKRTAAEQNALYQQGRTKPGKIVTNADGYKSISNHQIKADGYGYAVDLYPYYSGSVQVNDEETLKKLAPQIKLAACQLGVKISWGGDWDIKGNGLKKDYPHFELVK